MTAGRDHYAPRDVNPRHEGVRRIDVVFYACIVFCWRTRRSARSPFFNLKEADMIAISNFRNLRARAKLAASMWRDIRDYGWHNARLQIGTRPIAQACRKAAIEQTSATIVKNNTNGPFAPQLVTLLIFIRPSCLRRGDITTDANLEANFSLFALNTIGTVYAGTEQNPQNIVATRRSQRINGNSGNNDIAEERSEHRVGTLSSGEVSHAR